MKYETYRKRLERAAQNAIAVYGDDLSEATNSIVTIVYGNAKLMAALLSATPEQVERAARKYIEGLSHSATEGQSIHDQSLDSDSAGQVTSDSQRIDDPARTNADGSQIGCGSRASADLPSAPSYMRAAAESLRTIFDERIQATTDMTWGDITKRALMNLKIRNAYTRELAEELDKVSWPDLDTPLREFASEREVENIKNRAEGARSAAIAAVKQQEALSYGL